MDVHKEIELIVKNVNSNYEIESTNTYNKLKLNGYKMIQVKFEPNCDKTENFKIIKQMTEKVPDINKLITINISHCDLTEIPLVFHTLRLRTLDVSHNNLRNIPQCFYMGLKEIEHLNLSYNPLNQFERDPLCLFHLKYLNVTSCNLKNLPKWISKCLNIQEFYYNFNEANDLKKYFSLSCNFKRLEFKNTGLLKNDLLFFKNFPLQHLDISNEFNYSVNSNLQLDVLLDKPKWLRSLKILRCNKLYLCEIPNEIGFLENLQELHLEENYLIKLPNCIVRLINLKVLNVSKNSLFTLPLNLHELINLEVLKASYNSICEINLENTRLKYLDLYHNELDEIQININEIDFIDLEQNNITTDLGEGYVGKLKNLRLKNNEDTIRKLGKKICHDEVISESSYSNTSYDSQEEEEVQILYEEEEESWDCYIQNDYELVSLSDNEYTGDSYVLKGNIEKKISNTDYLYSDVD